MNRSYFAFDVQGNISETAKKIFMLKVIRSSHFFIITVQNNVDLET